MSEQNKALVQRWFDEVWNKRRAAAIDEMLSDEAIVHGLDPAPAGNDRFKQFHAAFSNGLPDLSVRIARAAWTAVAAASPGDSARCRP